MRRWRGVLLAGALVGLPASLPSQTRVSAPGGILAGAVRDSLTGVPVSYALVILVERNQRTFASEGGRFSLSGVASGTATLRVQQIGYRAVSLALVIEPSTDLSAGPGLSVLLSRQPLVLPAVLVRAEECQAGTTSIGEETGTILDEAFKNAERLLTLQKDYPYRASMRQLKTIYGPNRRLLLSTVDTNRWDSRAAGGYRRGKVLSTGDRESATYFEPADLAREEFRQNHCFWFDGRDSTDGFAAYRIGFRPLTKVKSADWAGSLVIDSATMHLLRSEAHLVNIPRGGSLIREAGCTVLYMQVVPTLVSEFQAACRTIQNSAPPLVILQRLDFLEFAFIGRRPDSPDPP